MAVSLLTGIARQIRVIRALIIRDMHVRWGRENLGFLWFFGEFLIFGAGVIFLRRVMQGESEHSISIIVLILTAYFPLLLFRHVVSRSITCIRSSKILLYHANVTILDIIVSSILIELLGNILAYFIAFFILYSFGLVSVPVYLPLFFLGYFYIAWWSIGLALVVAVLGEMSEITDKVWTPFSYLYSPICGGYILVAWLPERFRHIYLLLPSVSGFEMERAGYFGGAVDSFWNQPYIFYWSLIPTLLGLYLLRRLRRTIAVQ